VNTLEKNEEHSLDKETEGSSGHIIPWNYQNKGEELKLLPRKKEGEAEVRRPQGGGD